MSTRMSSTVKVKAAEPLSDHQAQDLRYIANAFTQGEHVHVGMLNMSAVAALMRRGLVIIVPTAAGLKANATAPAREPNAS